jgi:hypothetical protein
MSGKFVSILEKLLTKNFVFAVEMYSIVKNIAGYAKMKGGLAR